MKRSSDLNDDRGFRGEVVACRRPVNHAIKEVGLTEFSARPLRGESRPHRYGFGFVAWQQRTAKSVRDTRWINNLAQVRKGGRSPRAVWQMPRHEELGGSDARHYSARRT